MIRILFFSIVCAVSAPREGNAVIGRKSHGSNAFCHLDEGARKVTKPLLTREYNVDAHNSFVFAIQKITNRTNFHCDYNYKQCENSRSNSCSINENVSPRKKKESLEADEGLGFRKRNLLWNANSFSPKTVSPSMETENEFENVIFSESMCNWCNCDKPKRTKQRRRLKCKKPKCGKKCPKKQPQPYSLDCSTKRKLLRLKKVKAKTHKRHLDKVKIDDELDLNKRIQKLVQEIAVENQRAALTGCADQSTPAPDRVSEKWHKSLPFFKKLKKLFKFNEHSSSNKQLNNGNPNSVPVYTVRGEVPLAGKTAHLSSYDVLKTVRKTARFRRNPFRSYMSYNQRENPVSRYRDKLVKRKPFPYSTNFKKKGKFLYPKYRQRLLTEIVKPQVAFSSPRMGIKPRPLRMPCIPYSNIKDVRSKRHNTKTEQSTPNEGAAITKSDAPQTRKSEQHNDGEITAMESDRLKKPPDDLQSPGEENSEKSDDENVATDHTLEKPFFETNFRYDLLNYKNPSAELKTFEDRYNLQTDFPLFDNPVSLRPYRRYSYDAPKDGILNPYRYLKIRHALRNYLIHNNILSPTRVNGLNEREKRCGGGKCCPLPHKCWRSPPLLCIPYIRKGQDDLLRYLIRTMQKMIGKPFPPKIDIFDNTKFKPCERLMEHGCEDINTDDDDDCECMSLNVPPSCMSCPPPPPPPPQRAYSCQVETIPNICPCSRPVLSIPKSCPPNNFPRVPCSARAQSYLTGRRNYPCMNYNRPCFYPPDNSFRSNSAFPYPYDSADPVMYSTQSYYGYDEPNPAFSSPCMPPNPFSRNYALSTQPPPRPYPLSSQRPSTNYPPTPLSNIFPRATEQIPPVFTRPPYPSASTANACSWYMSKSPVERAEYFAYTALPFNGPQDLYTTPSRFSQSNLQSPYSISNSQTNQFNTQITPNYPEPSPEPLPSGINPQSNMGRFMYENQCKDKRKSFGEANQSEQGNAEQINQVRRADRGPTTFDMGDAFNENPQAMARCDDQQHHLNENQVLKQGINPEYPKNGNRDNAYKTGDQQLVKTDLNNEYPKPSGKEDNSRVVQMHPMLPPDGNDAGIKNQNREYGYKCDNQQDLNDQQMPKPEMNIKDVKNINKDEMLRCPDQQHTPNERPQLPKPDINEVNDDRRFFKTKHHKGILRNFKKPATEFFQAYDDYYDKYPFMDPDEQSGFRYGKSPFLRSWRGYSRKVKKSSKRGSSTRHKRGDNYYSSPDNFDNYNDYESEMSFNDEESADPNNMDESPPNWTPPSYEMFSELAKAVTEFNNDGDSNNSSASDDGTKENNTSLLQRNNEEHDSGLMKKFPQVSLNATSDRFHVTGKGGLHGGPSGSSTDDGAIITATTTAEDTIIADKTSATTITTTHPAPTITDSATAAIITTNTNTTPSASRTTSSVTTTDKESRAGNSEKIDSKKSGKTGFFQTNSKTLGIQSNSGFHTSTKAPNVGPAREDKGLDGDEDLGNAENGQIPTTLKMATIVKGPKKLLTKPSPKVYTKVYPDSLAMEFDESETTAATMTTAKTVVEKTTTAIGSTSDVQVQLLAVCEGYLEVVKLIKAHNQSLGNELDADLARYCENIISQNFNLQSESSKPNKQESIQSTPPSAVKNVAAAAGNIKKPKKLACNSSSTHTPRTTRPHKNEKSQPKHLGKVVVDILNNSLVKRQLSVKAKRTKAESKRKKLKCAESEDENDEGMKVSNRKEKSFTRKNEKDQTKQFCLWAPSNSKYDEKKTKRYRRKDESEEEFLKKGITKEQLELLRLLRKRKRALLTWLYNSKEVPSKSNDAQETEYFDDEEEMAQGSDIPLYSGTITPKEYEETSTTSESDSSFVNESIFPVYAKEYGYDRGGELMEVEVLWRKVNEKTHEKKIFRNRSVLALLLASTSEPNIVREDTRFIANGFENEDVSEIQSKSENKVGYAGSAANPKKKTSTTPTIPKTKTPCSANNTYTYIKPDPSSIVGAPPNVTKLHPNTSHKISHTFVAAKDLFQEYTLEFLNYAVYILPIMFTILFLFCCLCCAVQILKTNKCTRKHKKKKKRQVSTEDSETSEDSGCESKKKRREARRKKHCKDNPENLDKKRSRTFWNVLKLNAAKSNADYNNDCQTEKKRSFLRFLKGRREDCKAGFSSRYSPVHEVDEQDDVKQCHTSDLQYHDTRRRKDDNSKTYCQNEAEERRELIALLEELKKIETENTAEKKEVRSVHVQYMTQEDDTPVFQRPDFAFPYQKNIFGMPKGYSLCNKHFPFYQSDPATVRDYELFEDVNELTELLPCECNYYSKRNDYVRHCDFKINQEGGCKSLIKIFRDAGVSRSKPFREKNLFKHESENRSFIFNKYRSISTDTSDELMGVTQNTAGTEVRLTDNKYETASPLRLQSKKNTDFVEEMDSLKRQIKNKKHVRLKDDGVLCRL